MPDVTSPPADTVEPDFSRQVLLERVFNDEELLQQIVAMYLSDYPRVIGELATAVESDDAEAMAFAAHALKGSALSISAPRLAAISLMMENAGREGDVEKVRAHWPQAQEALNRLVEILKDESTQGTI